MANVHPLESSVALQQNKLECLEQLDAGVVDRMGEFDDLESAIRNYELAARMQTAVPEVMDISGETAETHEMYGLNAELHDTRVFGTECLLARRLVERGVRFVELTCYRDRWDHHADLHIGHQQMGQQIDQPIGALLTDLKRTGLWDETLAIWGGEFGRTPFSQGRHRSRPQPVRVYYVAGRRRGEGRRELRRHR